MTRPLVAIGAIFVKDWKLLWPLVLLNAAFFVARALLPGEAQQLAGTLSLCASALLIVTVVHLDAPAGLRLDWLTRPISPAALLGEKLLFVVVLLLLPAFAGELLHGLHLGWPLGLSLTMAGTDFVVAVPLAFGLMAIAALTRTFVEAGAVALAVMLFGAVIPPIALSLAGQPLDVVPAAGLWPLIAWATAAGMIGSALVLYLQYVPRRSGAARAILAATLLVLAVIEIVFAVSLSVPLH
jgi:hypothetical protein